MTKYRKPVEVSIPEAHDLGFCPVNHTSIFPFTIFNPNSKTLSYHFKFTTFIITPCKGNLEPNSYSSFQIQFKPTEANVVVGTIVLSVEGQNDQVYRLSAVGKYPYLSVSETDIEFGNVLVTKNVSKNLILKNNSEVQAQFTIGVKKNKTLFNDIFFTFNPSQGIIPPKMSFNVKINYCPLFTEIETINNFEIQCQSGNCIDINLRGYSHSFNVSFSHTNINFGEIKLDNTLNKVLTIQNNSQLECEFEFLTDRNNIFFFNEIKGRINNNSYKKIIINFQPRNTISYYQRIYCIIRNHCLLYVDLLGTCYDLLIKPLPILPIHINTFRKRIIQGRISEIQLKYVENNLLLKLSKRNQDTNQYNNNNNFYQSNLTLIEHPYILHKELFMQNNQNQLIYINHNNLQFGYCQIMTMSGQKEIEIINKLQCKLHLFWIIQKKQNFNGDYMTVYQIYPQTAILKPNVSNKFQIHFRPLKSNTFYFQHIQFYALKYNPKISKKTVQEFQRKQLKAKPQTILLKNVKLSQTIQNKVKQDLQSTQVMPSLSGSIRCIGHSFNPSSLPFVPIIKIFPSSTIIFPPCVKKYSVYSSIELQNKSDTPIYYKIGQDINKVFKLYPKIGVIEPKSFNIIILQFIPIDYKHYHSIIKIYLNDIPGSINLLNLQGICTKPQIIIQKQGQIYFAPTFINIYTKQKIKIQNISKNRIKYNIKIPQKYKQQIFFDPLKKQLLSNQYINLNVFFTAYSKKKYNIKIPIQINQCKPLLNFNIGYHIPGSKNYQNQQIQQQQQENKIIYWLQIHGQGSDGNLETSYQMINFQTVKISQQKKINFKLKNNSNCSFHIELILNNNNFEIHPIPTQSQINKVFKLDFKQGIIPANSELNIGIFFTPIQVMKFHLKLLVITKQKVPKNSNFSFKTTDHIHKCQMIILASGSYPLLQIIDIRNDTLSVASLWENLQIQKINAELSCQLDQQEKKYLSVEQYTHTQAKNLQANLKKYNWDLGYVSTKKKAKPRKVIISVKNFGGTPLDYCFKFPSDNKVKQQLWADPGEPTEEQAYEKAILDKNVFQITPKSGSLAPNQIKDIQLIYSPATIARNKVQGTNNEIHCLRVVFQIKNGKSLAFNLKGTTLGPNQGMLTVKKNFFILPDTPIGLLQPLIFPIQVNNVGSIKVNYKTQIKYAQNEFPSVFKIDNPNHFIIPGQNHYIYCLYKPLMNKLYNFKILIHVFDFSKQIQIIELYLEGKNNIKSPNIIKKIPQQRSQVSQMGSKVFFSIQEIDFETMKAQSTQYKMIILYNISKEQSLTFDFPIQSQLQQSKTGLTCYDKILIEPSNGTLEANTFIELKITLLTSNNLSIYEGEILCQIIWNANTYSIQDNDLTQKDVMLTSQKQSLFLRMKKKSILNINEIKQKNLQIQQNINKQSILDIIFNQIISSTLNNSQLLNIINELQYQQEFIYDNINLNNPVAIGEEEEEQQDEKQIIQNNNDQIKQKIDFTNHQNVMITNQFKDITEIIMENTFFNIIQETTHKENDFLRVGKKFIQADPN